MSIDATNLRKARDIRSHYLTERPSDVSNLKRYADEIPGLVTAMELYETNFPSPEMRKFLYDAVDILDKITKIHSGELPRDEVFVRRIDEGLKDLAASVKSTASLSDMMVRARQAFASGLYDYVYNNMNGAIALVIVDWIANMPVRM